MSQHFWKDADQSLLNRFCRHKSMYHEESKLTRFSAMEPSESPKNNGTVQDPTTGSLKEIANNSYRQAVVVYIDILGFKKLIDDSKRNPEKVSEIAAILEAAKSRLGLAPGIFFLSREKASNAFFTQNFSDLTVRVRFIDHDSRIINDEEYASEAINEIAHLGRLCTSSATPA